MFTDKAQGVISMAKDRAHTLGRVDLNVENILAAMGADREAGVRLAECLTKGDVADLRGRCPEYGSPGRCPGTMKPGEPVRMLLETACGLAGSEGIPHPTHPGLVALEHLVCATAMSPAAVEILGTDIVPITMKEGMSHLSRWLSDANMSVPLGELSGKLRGLRAELLSKVFGQDHAVHTFVEGLYNAQVTAGADMDRRHPMGVFVFAGPPGVGKTYMSELCADHLQRPFKRFDMTSYSDHQACNELVGFAPSYKEAKPGILTGFVKKNPNAILLFDEIEKAHLTTMQLFYQVLDAGRLQDKFEDEDVSFRDTIIIFTTNAGRSLYETPNASGIVTINAAYHRQTILSALANEKNPANGLPAFPPAICSRLAQGYPLMFNHLGVTELERIADTELARTEALLERQYFKAFEHGVNLPISLVLRSGANADARHLRFETERFVKSELFQFCSLYEAQRIEEVLDRIDEIRFDVDDDALTATPEIERLFSNPDKPVVLLVAEEEFSRRCEQEIEGVDWLCASSPADFVSLMATHDVDMVLLDLWLSPPSDSPGLSRSGLGSTDSGVLQTSSDFVDHVPLSSRALRTGRDILGKVRERFPETPVYLLSFQDSNDDERYMRTALFDERRDDSFQRGKRQEIDDELFLACVRAGGARGLISTEYGVSTSSRAKGDFTEAVGNVLARLYREKVARQLAKRRQSLDFDTNVRLDDESRMLTILIGGFRLRRVVDAEDVGGMVSDVERPDTCFEDVIGADAAKKSLKFIVEWLANPKRYVGLGLKPPKGILLTGPPGTGKTMLARAVAGESDCAFIQESAANFVTIWQGSGPENVRKLFDRARKYAPSIVFIDEIDAVGKSRQGGTSNESRETTLNCILTEMDGFGATSGPPVIVLAATNLADKLDPALKRRFDREVEVGLPDKAARMEYLRRVFADISQAEVKESTLDRIANQSARMTVAWLARVVQEAGVMATEANSPITDEILLEAFEKMRMGEAKPTTDKEELLCTARHEVGHAYVAWKSGFPIYQLTIIGRGSAAGYMEFKHDEDDKGLTKSDMEARIRVAMAGRAAELVYYGPEKGLSTGVGIPGAVGGSGSGDLPKASHLAMLMVRDLGMCPEIGQIAVDSFAPQYGEFPMVKETVELAEQIVSTQLNQAMKMIEDGRNDVDVLVAQLMESNRLDEDQIAAVLGPVPCSESKGSSK